MSMIEITVIFREKRRDDASPGIVPLAESDREQESLCCQGQGRHLPYEGVPLGATSRNGRVCSQHRRFSRLDGGGGLAHSVVAHATSLEETGNAPHRVAPC